MLPAPHFLGQFEITATAAMIATNQKMLETRYSYQLTQAHFRPLTVSIVLVELVACQDFVFRELVVLKDLQLNAEMSPTLSYSAVITPVDRGSNVISLLKSKRQLWY